MYAEISRNRRKTWMLMSLFTLVFLALGWVIGQWYFGDAVSGIIIATIAATAMMLIGYFKGGSVALATAGAKRIEKRDHPLLYSTVESLAITTGIPTPDIYIIEDPAANAFATGRDPKHAAVAVTTGLLEIMDRSELEGVIAHEISHVKNEDIKVMTIVVVLVGGIMLIADMLAHSFFFRRNDRGEGQIGLIIFLLGFALAILSPLFAQLIKLAISRSREHLADASGALITRYPEGLASALEKIAAHDRPLERANHATAHLFLANPFDPHVKKKFESVFSTHPPIEERIERLRTMGI